MNGEKCIVSFPTVGFDGKEAEVNLFEIESLVYIAIYNTHGIRLARIGTAGLEVILSKLRAYEEKRGAS